MYIKLNLSFVIICDRPDSSSEYARLVIKNHLLFQNLGCILIYVIAFNLKNTRTIAVRKPEPLSPWKFVVCRYKTEWLFIHAVVSRILELFQPDSLRYCLKKTLAAKLKISADFDNLVKSTAISLFT